MVLFGLVWYGLVWYGLVWFGVVWAVLVGGMVGVDRVVEDVVVMNSVFSIFMAMLK